MGKSVRMADIAEKLNISVESVSKALAGKRGVSEEMRAKIVALAREMGYEGNKGTAEQAKAGNVGVLVSDRFFAENAFYAKLYGELTISGVENGLTCMLEIISPEAERDAVQPTMVTGQKVEAIIFMGAFSPAYVEAVVSNGLPFVLLDFNIPDFVSKCVTSDNLNGGYLLTKHLIAQGRKKIGFVGSVTATSSIMCRYLGYQWAMREAGLDLCEEWLMEDRGSDGKLVPITLPETLPEAFLCSCDEVACHMVEQLRNAGKQVPEDVAVCGYDDVRVMSPSQPFLTTYRVNLERMAKAAVWSIHQQLRQGQMDAIQVIVPGQLIIRESA